VAALDEADRVLAQQVAVACTLKLHGLPKELQEMVGRAAGLPWL
jgi:hypothetical protein